jgi:hypothetical protein
MVASPKAEFDLARQLRTAEGAPLGEPPSSAGCTFAASLPTPAASRGRPIPTIPWWPAVYW